MANWAKLQEDLTGLKVVKRAKHGIHFDKGGGEVLANFVGKPCHFLDGGLWKPIDTKLLLLPDGYYGCPHSPVRVHTNGHVKVDGTDYQQYTELPSATGLVDNDCIVREFSFGKQEMRITENGYRSEITLNRIPTLKEARKLIASESGTLSKEYLKSLTTATDANNDVHTVSTLSAFRTWLASAAFPVVIDPDFGGTSEGGDVFINHSTRNYGAATSIDVKNFPFLCRFILSSISSDATCTAATLAYTLVQVTDQSRTSAFNIYEVKDANGDWIEGTSNNTTAKEGEPTLAAKEADGSGGVKTAWAGGSNFSTTPGTDFESTALATQITLDDGDPVGTVYTFTFNAAGISKLQSWFGDATNNGFAVRSGSSVTMYMGTAENATESYRPVLSVTYTAAGTFIPINMNAQMQNLSGNMRG